MTKKKRLKRWKREAIEWGAIVGIALVIYAMGWHTEVLGRMQQALLWTGIIQPDTELSSQERVPADFDMPLVSLDGGRTTLADFKGQVIFMNFWATWCAPCIAEMPNIQSLYEQYEDQKGISFVMISLDEDPAKGRAFLEKKEFTFGGYMLAGRRPRVFQSELIPSTFVISKSGTIVAKKKGMADYNSSSFRTFLDSLLNENAPLSETVGQPVN